MNKTTTSSERISLITTQWTCIFEAHNETATPSSVAEAQQQVLNRYSGCIYRYLFAATRNYDVADELAQEFALRFVRGDFQNAEPNKGRFRNYLKTSLRNLVNDHFRARKKRKAVTLHDDQAMPPDESLDSNREKFTKLWREELISHTWKSLKQFDEQNSNHYYVVLRYRADHPDHDATTISEVMSGLTGNPVSSDWVRQKLHRARRKFARLLMEEVRLTLPNDQNLEEELAELKLLKYIEL